MGLQANLGELVFGISKLTVRPNVGYRKWSSVNATRAAGEAYKVHSNLQLQA